MQPEDVLAVIESVKEDYQREEDQAILQHDLHKAEQALAGRIACERVERAMSLRLKIAPGPVRMTGRAR